MQEQVVTAVGPKKTKAKRTATSRKPATSVIVAVSNFQDELAGANRALVESLSRLKGQFEVIYVDDGSRDRSWEVLKGIAKQDKRVRLVRLRSSFGEAAAFDAGFKQARGKNIVFFTTRVRIDASQIDGLVRKLEQGCDLVMGWRHPRKDWPLNQTISRVFNWLIKRVSKIELNDVNSGVFAARRDVLEDVPMYGNLNIFLPILAARKGYVVSDEKIAQLPGEFRKSKYLTEYIQRLLDIVTVIFLTNYSKKPLHFLGFIGLVFALVGGLMNLYLFFYRVFQFGPIAGRPLLLLGALLLVIGIQMISIGLIGEMIIFTHAKEIKEYTIEEILE